MGDQSPFQPPLENLTSLREFLALLPESFRQFPSNRVLLREINQTIDVLERLLKVLADRLP